MQFRTTVEIEALKKQHVSLVTENPIQDREEKILLFLLIPQSTHCLLRYFVYATSNEHTSLF